MNNNLFKNNIYIVFLLFEFSIFMYLFIDYIKI